MTRHISQTSLTPTPSCRVYIRCKPHDASCKGLNNAWCRYSSAEARWRPSPLEISFGFGVCFPSLQSTHHPPFPFPLLRLFSPEPIISLLTFIAEPQSPHFLYAKPRQQKLSQGETSPEAPPPLPLRTSAKANMAYRFPSLL